MSKYKRHRGFTLLELLVTIAILGILLGIAAPGYRTFMNRQKVRATLGEWKSAFYFAQSEALRLKDGVIFCSADATGKQCSNSDTYTNGWLVLHDNGTGTPEILQDTTLDNKNITISLKPANLQGKLAFFGNGRLNLGAGASLTIKNKDHTSKVNILSAGRLRGE